MARIHAQESVLSDIKTELTQVQDELAGTRSALKMQSETLAAAHAAKTQSEAERAAAEAVTRELQAWRAADEQAAKAKAQQEADEQEQLAACRLAGEEARRRKASLSIDVQDDTRILIDSEVDSMSKGPSRREGRRPVQVALYSQILRRSSHFSSHNKSTLGGRLRRCYGHLGCALSSPSSCLHHNLHCRLKRLSRHPSCARSTTRQKASKDCYRSSRCCIRECRR